MKERIIEAQREGLERGWPQKGEEDAKKKPLEQADRAHQFLLFG
jgi:hypothetical protein